MHITAEHIKKLRAHIVVISGIILILQNWQAIKGLETFAVLEASHTILYLSEEYF